MAKKKKDKGIEGMIGGGLMLSVGSVAVSRMGAPAALPAAMLIPTQFIPVGVMAKMGHMTLKQMHRLNKKKRR